jgi:hypothetical protein
MNYKKKQTKDINMKKEEPISPKDRYEEEFEARAKEAESLPTPEYLYIHKYLQIIRRIDPGRYEVRISKDLQSAGCLPYNTLHYRRSKDTTTYTGHLELRNYTDSNPNNYAVAKLDFFHGYKGWSAPRLLGTIPYMKKIAEALDGFKDISDI